MNDNKINSLIEIDAIEKIGESGREGLSSAFSVLGNAISEIVKSANITNNLSTIIQTFSDSLRSAISGTLSQSYFKEFRQNIVDSLIDECGAAGSMGWCFHGIDKLGDKLSFSFFRKSKSDIDNGDISLADIDSYIEKQFSKEIINEISLKTEEILSSEDTIKFQKAMVDYRARRYYDAANLLAGLIDAQNIKEVLFHGNPDDNISQGLQAFAIAYNNKFSDKLDTSSIKPKSKKREDELTDFIETNKYKDGESEALIRQHTSLVYAIFSIFHNSDWHDYPNNKPMVINRHWLAHGMYDYDDVKKSDCLKLLFILNQVASLYQ